MMDYDAITISVANLHYQMKRIGDGAEFRFVKTPCGGATQIMVDIDADLEKVTNPEMLSWYHVKSIARKEMEYFASGLMAIIGDWDDSYVDAAIMDGTYWEVCFKRGGEAVKKLYGLNAYPENWRGFREFLAGYEV